MKTPMFNLLKPKLIGFKHVGMQTSSWWMRIDIVGGSFYVSVRPRKPKKEKV